MERSVEEQGIHLAMTTIRKAAVADLFYAGDAGQLRADVRRYLDGATVDWHEGLDRRGFTFDNPNAVKSCGCGNSFQA